MAKDSNSFLEAQTNELLEERANVASKFQKQRIENKLLALHAPLVFKCVREICPEQYRGFRAIDTTNDAALLTDANLSDGETVGFEGLYEAIRKFDRTKGVKFVTYAVSTVKCALRNMKEEDNPDYLLPVYYRVNIRKIDQAIKATGKKNPGIAEIARHTDLSETVISKAVEAKSKASFVRLDDYIFESEDAGHKVSLHETIASDELTPFEKTEKSESIEFVKSTLSTLSKLEKLVVSLKLGLSTIGLDKRSVFENDSPAKEMDFSKIAHFLNGLNSRKKLELGIKGFLTSRSIINTFHKAMRKMRSYQPVMNRYVSQFEKEDEHNKHRIDFLSDFKNQSAHTISDALITITVDKKSTNADEETKNNHSFTSLEEEAAFYNNSETISLFDDPEQNIDSSETSKTEEMELFEAIAEAILAIPNPSSALHKTQYTKAWVKTVMSILSD